MNGEILLGTKECKYKKPTNGGEQPRAAPPNLVNAMKLWEFSKVPEVPNLANGTSIGPIVPDSRGGRFSSLILQHYCLLCCSWYVQNVRYKRVHELRLKKVWSANFVVMSTQWCCLRIYQLIKWELTPFLSCSLCVQPCLYITCKSTGFETERFFTWKKPAKNLTIVQWRWKVENPKRWYSTA